FVSLAVRLEVERIETAQGWWSWWRLLEGERKGKGDERGPLPGRTAVAGLAQSVNLEPGRVVTLRCAASKPIRIYSARLDLVHATGRKAVACQWVDSRPDGLGLRLATTTTTVTASIICSGLQDGRR